MIFVFILVLIVCFVMVDGILFYGCGFGVIGEIVVELCFNIVMIGY